MLDISTVNYLNIGRRSDICWKLEIIFEAVFLESCDFSLETITVLTLKIYLHTFHAIKHKTQAGTWKKEEKSFQLSNTYSQRYNITRIFISMKRAKENSRNEIQLDLDRTIREIWRKSGWFFIELSFLSAGKVYDTSMRQCKQDHRYQSSYAIIDPIAEAAKAESGRMYISSPTA